MLIKGRINYPANTNSRLSRVWIKARDGRTPLKSVWIDNAKLLELCVAEHESEVAEDHLALVA